LIDFGMFWRFVWQVLINPFQITHQGRARMARNRLWVQMYEIGVKSVPVIVITGAFVAMTLAVQSYAQLKNMGVEDRLGSLINISVVKELGPVLAAFMLAGRIGGALTAELGTMRVTEQIDAIRALGSDPVRYLVWPRFLACVFLTPILTIYADVMGVFGGYAISVWHFQINSDAYWQFSANIVEKWDIFVGIGKGFFFGAGIALISCYKGFNCDRGAHGVGRACTEAFVSSFLAILVLNFVLAVISKAIYATFWEFKLMI
ncbi:MAG: ABC transporter permease, partial [Sedimentisphaerales bacterium]|nr:ABC transporter permease [Sedimentisphaerales bacterium]